MNEANNVASSVVDETNMISRYIAWVSGLEGILRNYYVDFDPDRLLTARYWHLRDLMHTRGGGRRIPESILDEARFHVSWMSAEADDLEARAKRFGDRSDTIIAIVDTNMFLHGEKELEKVPWRTLVPSQSEIRLVVPMRVIDELDEKKFFGANRVRARQALHRLAELIGNPNTPTSLGDGVTIESYVPPSSRIEHVGGDNEIVQTAEEVKTYARKEVVVITRDFGMSLRAKNAGLESVVAELPAEGQSD